MSGWIEVSVGPLLPRLAARVDALSAASTLRVLQRSPKNLEAVEEAIKGMDPTYPPSCFNHLCKNKCDV